MEKKSLKNKNEASASLPGPSAPPASSSSRPKVFTALCRDPKYRKANAEFLTRRLRLEFDKLTTTRPLCKAATAVTASREFLPPELQKCHQSNFRTNAKKSRKRKFPSYTKMRAEREEFRKTLVSLIVAKETDGGDNNDNTFPNAKERELLRYYYYIKHGIDTSHIAPMTNRILNKIIRLVPKRLTKWQSIIDANIDEIKSEYIYVSKKAVVDFVLGKSLDNNTADDKHDVKVSRERSEIKEIGKHHAHLIHVNRRLIGRNLYAITPCLRQMLSLWQTTYTKLSFVNADALLSHAGAFDLVEFITTINQQIEETRVILLTKWYDALKLIIANAMKRKIMPDATKPKSLKRFFDCVASQMTQCLQDIAVRSLNKFTEFMKNRSNPRIRLHVLLEDTDRLVFNPTFVKIHTEILHIVECILVAVQNFVRIEMTMENFNEMHSRSTTHLQPIISADVIDKCRTQITDILDEERIVPELMLQDFDDYIDLMNGADADKIYNFINTNATATFDEYCELINHYNDVEYEISMNIAGIISIGFYEFHRSALIDTLEMLAKYMQTELLTKMVADQQADMAQLQNEYDEISKQALTIPKNTAELMNSMAYATKTQAEIIPEMEKRLKLNLDHFLWLMDQTIYTPLEIKQNSITFQWYLKMASIFEQNEQIVQQKTIEYQELLRKRIEQFRRDLDLYWEQLLEYENWGDITFVAKYKRKANVLDARLTAALEKIERINDEERSFGWPLSEYPLRKQTHVKLMPYKKLFDAGQDFIEKRDLWLKSQVGSFDPVDIAKNIETIYDDLLKLSQGFDEHPQSKRLAEDIKIIIDEFKLNLPIIQTLGNPGLKSRHWEQISEMVGFPIVVSGGITLEKIIEFGLEDYLARFEKISQSATKENGLELAMSNMIVEWQGVEFSVNEYRDTGTYILASVNDIQTLLDDHIIKTQTMKNSPYIKPFETEILSWESKLVLLQEILDDWLRVQATWIYLEPIFSSPDIQQQMPEEGRRFGAVDKIWKELMKQVHLDPAVMSVVDIDKMSEKLKKAFSLLEIIQKGLHTYLEKKRLYFPRFYFLSNASLLEILAETKDPTQVELHLRKCFNGITSLTFVTDMLEISTMKSSYGEEVELIQTISTAKARGQVEKWLLELERVMKETVLAQIFDTFESYPTEEFGAWISHWPGQFVHTTFLLNFTKDIDSALLDVNCTKSSFSKTSNKLECQIEKTISLLRSDLSMGNRLNFRTLLILLIQAQNILNRLIKKNADSVEDFDWMGQMRYYITDNKIEVKMLLAVLQYGMEYCGNKSRMVVTPLTDRCYRIIFVALNQHFGLALQGDAGIGKTQLVKDLAKAIATYCISFNCANDLDYIVIGKFFKGFTCGAWVCLDNFNHIDACVLSVVAHYIQTIQEATKSAQQNFIIDGVTLPMNLNCAIFTTLSSLDPINCHEKLHDNLKTLFRPISMMLPDLQRIAEIELLSYGYENAKSLGTKIVTMFQLCKEQLIAQPHYDFGMRTLKIVLEMCERAKVQFATKAEESIAVEIIRQTIFCMLDDEDVNIFESILSDIFAANTTTTTNNNNCSTLDTESTTSLLLSPTMRQAILDACSAQNINATEYFVGKVYQIYEMLNIRPGVMIIGESFAGKTTAYRILAKALALLEQQQQQQQNTAEMSETHPICTIINPKSVTIGRLYGVFDSNTHEWRDGILAINFKHFINANVERRKWLIFDGPVDCVWMENINSVLDDNRKLCLVSGDIFHLEKNMNLLFEAMDLRDASPAIISRCGIIYMSSSALGWRPLLESWKAKLPHILEDVNKQEITNLFIRFCPILLYFIRNCGETTEMLATTDSNLVTSLMNLFECFFDDYYDEKTTSTLAELDIRAQLEGMFFFACIWSLGGALNEASRLSFSELFHGLLLKDFPNELYAKFNIPSEQLSVMNLAKPYIFTIPKAGNVFDYRFICEGKGKWKLWHDEIALAPPLSRDISVNQIIITTKETVRIYALLDLLVRHGKPTLLVGPTASGKTIYALDFLSKKIDSNAFVSINMNFTAGIVASQVQEIIMARLNKRRKGVYGPPLGRKCVIFIDDLSLPELDVQSSSQSSVELMRMWMDHSMWYEHKDLTPIKLIDLQIMCAMLSPRYSSKSVTSRFLRHFNIISIDEFDNETLRFIFSKIVLWHLDARGFSKEFDPCIDEIVLGTLSIFNKVKTVLLPTPSRPHYQFNIRDFSRCVQGVLLSVPEAIEGIETMRRLWSHEICRVYGDRLVSHADQKWLFNEICSIVESELHSTPAELFSRFIDANKTLQPEDLRKLMFCDFTNPKADTRSYTEVQDLEELRYVVECYLVEFNNMSKRPMNLTMFRYTVEHLSKICRVLKQPRSHLLLLGVGGSGRQSYTRLAAHIMDFELFQIELTRNYSMKDWTEFLKAMLLKVTSTESHGVFLITDAQIKDVQFLDDISNLLQSGEVLRLFDADEIHDIREKMLQIDKQRDKSIQTDGSPKSLYELFVNMCREQLHIIVCMSPVNRRFHEIIRDYPSFINTCTLDWFHTWPDDGLQAVSQRFLAEGLEFLTETQHSAIIKMFMAFFNSTMLLTQDFFTQYHYHIYIPPMTFVESIHIFKEKLLKKKIESEKMVKKYRISLERVADAAEQMDLMQTAIDALEPQCKVAAEKVAKQVSDVQTATEAVDEQREIVKKDEIIVSDQTAQHSDLFEHCKNILEEAIPQMKEAHEALSSLTPPDLASVRTMKNPPMPVKVVMEAICILRDIKPEKANPSIEDYWSLSKKMLNDPKYVEYLLAYEKDNISDQISEKLQEKVLSNDAFDVEKIKLISVACEQLCKWVIAIVKYDRAAKIAAPKRLELKEAQSILDASTTQLNGKIEELRLLEDSLSDLQKQLKIEKDNFESLKTEHERCSKRLQRATEIVASLGGEKERWQQAMENIELKSKTLIGDVLISSGIVAYLGQLTESYRNRQIREWIEKCSLLGLFCDPEFQVEQIFADEIQVKSWNVFGLPDNRFAIESAVILQNTRRWTLIIDPQGFANKWIKNLEKENRLCIIQLSQPDYLRVLENAIQYGLPVLLENVGHELEPIMESVLMKEVFRQSGARHIKLGESIVEYNDAFKMYLTTKLAKPNYTAEVSAKCAILDFRVTSAGMESYLLGVTISRDRPDVEAEKNQISTMKVDINRTLKNEENKVLDTLSTDENLLENDGAVQLISTSKIQSNELLEKLSVSNVTEKQIDITRTAYKPLAKHAAVIYFTIDELMNINQMYQYSLAWFVGYLKSAIDNTDKVDDVQQRIKDLKKFFTYFIYTKLCRSLQEKEKIVFSTLLAKNISVAEELATNEEWSILFASDIEVVGNNNVADNDEESKLAWISTKSWLAIKRLSRTECFANLMDNLRQNEMQWQNYVKHTELNEINFSIDFYRNDLTSIQKLLLFNCFQPAKLLVALYPYICEVLGNEFTESPPFDLAAAFSDSTCCKPLLFILSCNYDPITCIRQLAETQLIEQNRLKSLSMGQHQNSSAIKLIEDGIKTGDWIILQNCHLAADWMNVLERICDNLAPDTTNPDFRLFLTTNSTDIFPLSIIQGSVKLVNEPPKRLRDTLWRTFTTQPISNENWLNENKNSDRLKAVLYSLSILHGIMLERRNFGAIGWNRPYDFNDTDLYMSIYQFYEYLNSFNCIPFETLQILLGECSYGGHMNDLCDLKLLKLFAKYFCSRELCDNDGKLANNTLQIETFFPHNYSNIDSILTHIKSLDDDKSDASICGLNRNANVLREQCETNFLIRNVTLTQQNIGLSGQAYSFRSLEAEHLHNTIKEILEILPNEFDLNSINAKYPISKTCSLNLVLRQEVRQYNQLLKCIRNDTVQVLDAIQGRVILSRVIETVAMAIANLKIPDVWILKSYPTLKSLASFIKDLQQRIQYFQAWIENGSTRIHWLPVFFSAQSFFVAILQNYSRTHTIAYSLLTFDYLTNGSITNVGDGGNGEPNGKCVPEIGCLVNGLFLDGGAWCHTNNHLVEPKNGLLFNEMATIYLKPTKRSDLILADGKFYECPLYKTSQRHILVYGKRTTNNFITFIRLNCTDELPPNHWILRGCALICQLND